jgi:tetratricopeptide (TPR) repeat protein
MSSHWCFAEITHAKALGKHVLPVKIAACEINRVLTANQVLDLTEEKEEGYRRLQRGLLAAGLDPDEPIWDKSRPPYPGLMAFQEEDAAVFFGRDPEIQQGLETLRRLRQYGGDRMVVVLGSSGSGKSSVVRAGYLPSLRRSPEEWLIIGPFRPMAHPLRRLALGLAAAFEHHGEKREWREIQQRLESGGMSELVVDLQEASGYLEATVLLIIDQLEELLTYGEGAEAGRFVPILESVVNDPGGNLMALCTMRSDFLDAFQRHEAARGLRFETIPLAPMATDRLVDVINGPARLAAVELEPGLSDLMIRDTATEDALPLLAFTLRELYERYGDDDLLEIEEYRDRLGGLEGSVGQVAEEVFGSSQLTSDQRADLRHALRRMVYVDPQGRYARQAIPWESLSDNIHDLMELFVKKRLMISRVGGAQQGRMLEVAHEALFRSWDRLKEWLDDSREFIRWRKTLVAAMQDWERDGRKRQALLKGPLLDDSRAWLKKRREELLPETINFIEGSINQARRSLRVLAGATVLFFLVAVAAGVFYLKAADERRRAQLALDTATDAINEMLTQVGSEWLRNVPQMEELSADLLGRAEELYLKIAGPGGDSELAGETEDIDADNITKRLNLRVALVPYHLSEIHKLKGKLPVAEKQLLRSIAAMERLQAEHPEDLDYRQELAKLNERLGLLLGESPSREDNALDKFNLAIAMQEGLLEKSPKSPELRQYLVRFLYNRGLLLMTMNEPRLEEAERDFVRAVRNTDPLPEGPEPLRAKLLQHRGRSHNNLAILRSDPKNDVAPKEDFLLANEAFLTLHEADKDNRQYALEVAKTYNNLAIHALKEENNPQEAIEFSAQAFERFHELEKPLPHIASELANALNSRGNILVSLNRPEEAAASLAEACAVLEQLVLTYPERDDDRYRLAIALVNLGNRHFDVGNRAEARKAFEKLSLHLPRLEPDRRKIIGDSSRYRQLREEFG